MIFKRNREKATVDKYYLKHERTYADTGVNILLQSNTYLEEVPVMDFVNSQIKAGKDVREIAQMLEERLKDTVKTVTLEVNGGVWRITLSHAA